MATTLPVRVLIASILSMVSAFAQEPELASETRARVESFLTEFHAAEAAADARGLLDCFREDAIVFGTAPGERYGYDEFSARVERAFARGRGRTSELLERHVAASSDGSTAWFDELLRRETGIELRLTGVLRHGENGWKLVLLDKVLPVANERAYELAAKIREVVPRPKRSIPRESEPAKVLLALHRAAAKADLEGYLGHLAEDAVFLGTAADERHTPAEIREMLAPYFASGQGLETKPAVINLTESEDGRFAWFDARLDKPRLCELRGSGLLRREESGWKIVQYGVGFPVPNDRIELAVAGLSAFTTPLEVEALRTDFALLRETLEEWHPALYVYETKEEIDLLFEQTAAAIDEPMTPLEFEALITPVVARVHCVHTRILPRAAHYAARCRHSTYLPVEPQVIGGRLFVRTCYGEGQELTPGTEILEIDGRSAEEIVERLLAVISADGRIESRKLAMLNEGFNLLYATHLGSPAQFELRVRERDSGEVHELTVPALDYESWSAGVSIHGPQPPPGPGEEPELQVLPEEDVAILTHHTFQLPDLAPTAKSLETFFSGLRAKGLGNLIVDLRSNPGGDPQQGALLVSYLADEPFTYFRFDPEENSLADALALREFTSPRPPAEHYFRGRIFVLIGGRNSSTAGHVISLLKHLGRVKLIGQASGATWLCNDNSKDLLLPASGLQVHIARTTYGAAVDGFPPGESIRPHHEVEPTVEAMLAGRDLEMELALELAREEN